MKPVDQAVVHRVHGDCWSACLASILELPLEAVPKFMWHFDDTDRAAELWLSRFGYSHLRLHRYINSNDERYFWNATGFNVWHADHTHCIVSGKSPNLEGCFHAVVGYIDYGGVIKIAHDPSPHKRGILGAPYYLGLLVAKDPAGLSKPRHDPGLGLQYFN